MQETNNELMHYGVRGMRWGVRRATNKLSKAATSEQKDKAIKSLNKHRDKATAKIAKLSKKEQKLNVKRENMAIKTEKKAAKYERKAAKTRNKKYRWFTTMGRAKRLEFKATKFEARAANQTSKVNLVKAKLNSNKTTQEVLRKGINDIDQALVDAGKRLFED